MVQSPRVETQLIHAGEPNPRIGGSAAIPIFHSTVYEHAGGDDYHGIPYPRLSNLPNHEALRHKLAALERGEDALVAASGMAAIATSLLAVAAEGHVLVQDCLYGGTHGLFAHDLPAFGITCDVIDSADPASWGEKLRPNTRAIYTEALTNPLLQVIDHRAVVDFARAHGLVSMIDSTFATPINFRPLEIGYDLSLHSATKYLNGHSDLVAGAVAGKAEIVQRVKRRLDHFGGSLDPHACYMMHRGMRTLALRVRHQNDSAAAIARFLEEQPGIEKVNYPGLDSHPQHELAKSLFSGFSGMLSFETPGGADGALALIERLSLPVHGPSLGGVESLVSLPARLSHASLTPEERAAMGIGDGLIRMSVGLEATEDLIEDLDQALKGVAR